MVTLSYKALRDLNEGYGACGRVGCEPDYSTMGVLAFRRYAILAAALFAQAVANLIRPVNESLVHVVP